MALYAYTGRGADGAVSGTLDGANPAAVAEALAARGIVPLNIQVAAAPVSASPISLSWNKPKVQPADMLLFARQLHTLLKSGVPILRALAGLQETATNPAMKNMLHELRRSLESGVELSSSMAQMPHIFDPFFVAMVRVGEGTGRLDDVFMRLFHHMEFELFMRQQVKSALRYPSFVVIAMVVAIVVINILVIPAFADVFKGLGAELPLATRMLIAGSDFTRHHGWVLVLLALGGFHAWRRWTHTPDGRLRWSQWLLRMPIVGDIVTKASLSRFARAFSLTLSAGVPLERALGVVAQTADNAFIASRIETLRDHIARGEPLAQAAAATGVFTPIVLQMIAVGEETGAVDELLVEVAELYNNDVQYALKTLSQQIEPILIVFLGAMVLVLALGIFLPMWDLGQHAIKH